MQRISKMRIAFLTLGTRGDVQPYLALAKELVRQGHSAVVCTSESFRDLIEAASVEYRRAALDLMHLSSTEEGRRVLESPWKNLRLAWKMTHEIIRPGYRKTFDDFYEAACGCDMIVYHPKAFAVPDIAMHLNIPCISMPPIPTTYPITEFSCLAVFGGRNFGARINRLSYALNAKAEHTYIKEINDFKVRTLGLGKRSAGQYTYHMDEEKIPIVYPVSKYLFEDVSSWNGHVQLPGFFFLQSRETLPEEAADFLANGAKPIVVAFGSMPLKHPARFMEILSGALNRTGSRAIIVSGNTGIRPSGSAPILVIKQAPYTELFRRAKAVVHHGGAGTTAAAIAGGVPQFIMPFAVDQPFWAARVYRRGISPPPAAESSLTEETLAKIFLSFDDAALIERAALLGERINAEKGTENAAAYLLARA